MKTSLFIAIFCITFLLILSVLHLYYYIRFQHIKQGDKIIIFSDREAIWKYNLIEDEVTQIDKNLCLLKTKRGNQLSLYDLSRGVFHVEND